MRDERKKKNDEESIFTNKHIFFDAIRQQYDRIDETNYDAKNKIF